MGVLLREAVGASGRKWLSCGRIICSHGDQRCWAPDAGPLAGACGSFIDRERERERLRGLTAQSQTNDKKYFVEYCPFVRSSMTSRASLPAEKVSKTLKDKEGE